MTNRDNEKRSGAAAMPPVGALPQVASSGATLTFAAPTEIVELPSEGKFYPKDHPLHGVSQVEIRHMTAKEEDILTNSALIRKGLAIDRMLESIVLSPKFAIEEMQAGDKNALAVAARITGFGAEYVTKIRCVACGETSDHKFDLNQAEILDGSNPPDGVEITEKGTFMVTGLPKCEHAVELRLMTGRDEQALVKSSEKKKKHKLPPTLITDQMKMVIVSVGGSDKPADINGFVNTMPLLTTKALQKIYRAITPNIDLTQDFTCENCEHSELMEVPFSTEFFWPKQ